MTSHPVEGSRDTDLVDLDSMDFARTYSGGQRQGSRGLDAAQSTGVGSRPEGNHTNVSQSTESSPVRDDYGLGLGLVTSGVHTGQDDFTDTSPISIDGTLVQGTFPTKFSSDTTTPSEEAKSTKHNQADNGGEDDPNTGAPPPWSELKTKAGKERKRLPLACIACRRKKIRCSGEKPACKHCLRSRIPCVYKVTTRKAAPRTDYMAMLDKRLKRMEERVIKILPKDEQDVVERTGRAVVKPTFRPTLSQETASPNRKRPALQAFEEELEDWASTTKSNAAGKGGGPEMMDLETPSMAENDEHDLLHEGADKLPPKELQEHLSEVFFDYVYGQSYHLLHKPSFMRKLAQGTIPPVLILAICAISARFSNHPSVRTDPAFLRGEDWASAARDIAMKRYDVPNLTILIVYLILGLHEFGTCHGGRSWMFGGMAQRMAYALQLHKDLDHDPRSRASRDKKKNELTFTDREIRRRTMWCCFIMDRFNSSGTERPIFVGEQYIRAQLPIKEKFYHMELTGPTEDLDGQIPNPIAQGTGEMADAKDNMGVAAYLIRLVSIWGKLVNYLNLGGKERDQHPMWAEESEYQVIKRQAKRWGQSLPASLHYTPENLHIHASEKIANQFIFMHIVYNQILLFMHRFAVPAPGSRRVYSKEMPELFITEATRCALEAANQISALIQEAMDHTVVAPFAGYAAFFSSTVHLHGVFSKNPQLEATSKQNLAWNVKYLTKMKKYWGMFHFVTDNLRDLYRRHADAARSGDKGQKDEEAEIFQYGDWFDRYPQGISGADHEEPNLDIKKEPGSDAVLGQKSDLQTVEEFFSKLTPPSKAVQIQRQQHQQQQQQQTRKPPKKRRPSKAETAKPPPATAASRPRKSSMAGQSTQQQQQQQQQQTSPIQMNSELMSTQAFNTDMATLPQQPMAFTPGFQQPNNPLLVNTQQPFLTQLDQHMVLDPSTNMESLQQNSNSQGMQPKMGNNNNMAAPGNTPNMTLDPFDFGAMSSTYDQNSFGFWDDPSTGWFMPFNVNPPVAGEEGNSFGGDFDWSNFAGLPDASTSGFAPGDPASGQSIKTDPDQAPDAGDDPMRHLTDLQ